MKNKILYLLLLIAIFIPTVVAVSSYKGVTTAPVSAENVRSMELCDLSGKTYTFSSTGSTEEQETIRFFWDMNDNATKITGLPTPLIGTNFFKVTMRNARKAVDYQYYFSTESKEAYYITGANTYRIAEADAAKFLSSRYAVSLYLNAITPELTVSDKENLTPVSALWMYKNSAGQFVECETEVAESALNFDLEGGIDMFFSIQPDSFAVKLTDVNTGIILFDDQYANIGNLTVDRSVNVLAEVDAKWYEDEGRDYYGEMRYTFRASIAAPAAFALGLTKIQNGEFTVVTAKNIADVSRISFSSVPDIGFTPTFYEDGDYAIALIPIRLELGPETYNLTFKYGGVTQTLPLTVTQRTQRTFDYTISANIVASTRTDKTMTDFKSATYDLMMKGEGAKLWDGNFVFPVDMNGKKSGFVTTGFGYTRIIKATGVSYTHDGADYCCLAGSPVYAMNNGKVVFAEYTEYGGNTIIIEHGYGLKSWYCHLSELNVRAGDSVTMGQVIGIVGQTGFTNQIGMHEALTVFDVPVSPYPPQDDGILIVYPD